MTRPFAKHLPETLSAVRFAVGLICGTRHDEWPPRAGALSISPPLSVYGSPSESAQSATNDVSPYEPTPLAVATFVEPFLSVTLTAPFAALAPYMSCRPICMLTYGAIWKRPTWTVSPALLQRIATLAPPRTSTPSLSKSWAYAPPEATTLLMTS